MRNLPIHLPPFLLTLALIGALFGAALFLTEIDTDIIRYLPRNHPVLDDAGRIFEHHPMQGEMVIDLAIDTPDPDRLVLSGRHIEQRLKQSGLFAQVGTESMQTLFPELLGHVVGSLPVLFTAEELDSQVLPLIAPDAVRDRLAALHRQLLGMETIGQTEFIARDPLELRTLVLAKLAHLAPAANIDFYKGQLLSADHRHLLVPATPAVAGTDTAFARRMADFMHTLSEDPALQGITLTPMGAYRAALDNETIARKDVQKAIVLATLGIALLLVLVFSRPLLGLFAFLPAAAGTVTAFFALALMHDSVSILALGFGGAIISITVDHGIAYLLFLDRSSATTGRAAAREVWAIGLIAALTTIGAFSALNLTGFPVLAQLGQFAAIGIAASFLFVHLVFPRIFPHMPPAPARSLPLRRLAARLPVAGRRTALAALAFMAVMLFFARPNFNAELSRMNTVGRETAAAQELVTRVWGGGIFDRLFLINEAQSFDALRRSGDRLSALLAEDIGQGRMSAGFLPAMLFPGPERRQENFAAWTRFWDEQRIGRLQRSLEDAAQLGFAGNAFAPFLESLALAEAPADQGIPAHFHPLLHIVHVPGGAWMQFATLTPGPGYDASAFYARYAAEAGVFDPSFFSKTLGQLLFSTFIKMLAVIGVSVALLIFFFFLDVRLTLITLLPVLFAMAGTLGSLHLAGHALDIPALMLGIIVMGMGIDYALFLVRAYQRYGGLNDPAYERIKLTVLMAAASTLIGFGVLCTADHALLYSAGITSFLGISFSVIGAFTLLPPLLRHHFEGRKKRAGAASSDSTRRILNRYSCMEVNPRLFARFKLKMDPMFSELPLYLNGAAPPRTVLDIGCGFGVPGCWVLEHFDEARIYGIDPIPERIRVAAAVYGERGWATCDRAPNIPEAPEAADAAMLLDMIHFINDEELGLTLRRLHAAMNRSAVLIIRAVVPPDGRTSLHWKLDALRMKLRGIAAFHRPVEDIAVLIEKNGFRLRRKALSGNNPESVWVIAERLEDER